MIKLIIVGFDGLEPTMLTGYPTFARFATKLYQLRSVPSTATQEAWASLYTGLPPSRLGLLCVPRYAHQVSTLKGIPALTFFEALSQEGFTIGSIGMPMTFPVKPLKVFMVAGFPLPAPQYRSDREYFYPTNIKDIVDGCYYAYLGANQQEPPRKDAVTYEMVRESVRREGQKILCARRILDRLAPSSLDLLAIGFSFTDIAAHCRRVYPIEKTYAAADSCLAAILRDFKFENLMVVSDHGLALKPWRGKAFGGFDGIGHRRFGTLICSGEEVEEALSESSRLPTKGWQGEVERFTQMWKRRQHGGWLRLPVRAQFDALDITQVYSIVLKVFHIDKGPCPRNESSVYSQEEEESIRKQLELLGYLNCKLTSRNSLPSGFGVH